MCVVFIIKLVVRDVVTKRVEAAVFGKCRGSICRGCVGRVRNRCSVRGGRCVGSRCRGFRTVVSSRRGGRVTFGGNGVSNGSCRSVVGRRGGTRCEVTAIGCVIRGARCCSDLSGDTRCFCSVRVDSCVRGLEFGIVPVVIVLLVIMPVCASSVCTKALTVVGSSGGKEVVLLGSQLGVDLLVSLLVYVLFTFVRFIAGCVVFSLKGLGTKIRDLVVREAVRLPCVVSSLSV